MRAIDWAVFLATLAAIAVFGAWQGRRQRDLQGYVLAGHAAPWWGVLVSVMATQASAVTFLSTTGQGYADGLRFVQFYFGLPLAMVFLVATLLPLYYRAGVYTAYEYLERRFDAKTRALAAGLFLVQRGLAAGITIYAPSAVLSVLLGWPIGGTTALMGGIAVLSTTGGGAKAVGRTQFVQFLVILAGMGLAFAATVRLLPEGVGLGGALEIARARGRLEVAETRFDWNDRYTLFSGIVGGFFLQLAYFGTDQSQVQRYLTAESAQQSRKALLWNGLLKIPMQLAILFVGVMVFSVHHFSEPPIYANPVEVAAVEAGARAPELAAARERHHAAFLARRQAVEEWLAAEREPERSSARLRAQEASAAVEAARQDAARLVAEARGKAKASDVNYVFLRFVLDALPVGLVGLVLAAVFCAALSAVSAELNALATTSLVDGYRRFLRPEAPDLHFVRAGRALTVLWGAAAVGFAQFANRLGTLVEAVNILGSLFYGTILGIFLTGFFVKRAGGTAVCLAALAGEAVVLALFFATDVSFLWYNAAGCLAVLVAASALSIVGIGAAPVGSSAAAAARPANQR